MIKLIKYFRTAPGDTGVLRANSIMAVLAPLFKLFEAFFELLVPLVVARMIDLGIGQEQGDKPLLYRMAAVLAVLAIVGFVSAVTAQYFAARASVGFAARLRRELLAKIHSMSYSRLDRQGTSKLLLRITGDVNTVQNGVNMTLRLLLRSPLIIFGAAAMAFTVDRRAAFIFVIVIPVLFAVVLAILLLSIPMYKKVQARLEGLLRVTGEAVAGARVIRAFGREEHEGERFSEENAALNILQKLAGHVSALTNPLTYVILNAALIILIYTGALRVDAGIISVGAVIALYNYMSQILVELIKLANLIITLTRAVASAARISETLGLPPENEIGTETGDDGADIAACFENVSLRYNDGAEPVLEKISFSAHRGESIGIIGGTGSGKTSLVNLLGRYYIPSAGTVSVLGLDVTRWSGTELRSRVALVPQKAVLFSGTVRENLRFGDETADDTELEAALRSACAYDFIAEKGGLGAKVSQGGGNFSGGQRQRLTIARALVRRAPVLILDDSASALDMGTEAALRRNLAALDWHPTVFTVSQRTSSVMHCDLIIVLEDGSAAGIGTHDELLAGCPVYREIYESQYGGEAAS